jgi:hypothetical protein
MAEVSDSTVLESLEHRRCSCCQRINQQRVLGRQPSTRQPGCHGTENVTVAPKAKHVESTQSGADITPPAEQPASKKSKAMRKLSKSAANKPQAPVFDEVSNQDIESPSVSQSVANPQLQPSVSPRYLSVHLVTIVTSRRCRYLLRCPSKLGLPFVQW